MSSSRTKSSTQLTLLDERYELLSVIGRGGNSLVYTARPTVDLRLELQLPELVTVKLFSDTTSSPEILERIQREAMILKSLNHPRVIKLYDYAATLELSYLVLEHASRGDVKSLLEERGRLEQSVALRFAVQMLDAIQAVHNAGIVHRDVKPENLLILEDGTIRLCDFGVSTFLAVDPVLHNPSDVVQGTLGYIAPEQLEGAPATKSSDIFSAGVAIFEMLSGKLPFEGNSLTELLSAMTEGRSQSLVSILGEKYRSIERVLRKALCPNPDERYQSALSFRRDVERVIWNLEAGETSRPSQRQGLISLPSNSSLEAPRVVLDKPVESPRGKYLSIFSLVMVLVCAVSLLFIGGGSATANLRREAPVAAAKQESGFFSMLFGTEKEHGAYGQVKSLSLAPHAGVFYNLLGDGQNVFFSTAPVRTSDGLRADEFILSIGLNGFKPQLITLSPDSNSRELLIAAGGLKLVLEISDESLEKGAHLSGKFRDLSTGRENRWAIY